MNKLKGRTCTCGKCRFLFLFFPLKDSEICGAVDEFFKERICDVEMEMDDGKSRLLV
jgi:hypothetical protein